MIHVRFPPPSPLTMSPDNGSRPSPIHEARRAIFKWLTLFLEKIAYALPKEHTICENATKFSEDQARGSGSFDYQFEEYGDPKVGGVNGMGDGHGSHLSTGGVGGRGKMKLADMCTEQARSVLMLTAVYFGVVGFSNTIIARGLQRDDNEALSFIKDLSKANHSSFQVFVLVNIVGFTASSGSLLIRSRGKLKSEIMFLTCSFISILCMAFSFVVLLICAFRFLLFLAFNDSNV